MVKIIIIAPAALLPHCWFWFLKIVFCIISEARTSKYLLLEFIAMVLTNYCKIQLCLWSIDTWEKRKSVPIQLPAGKAPSGDTRVQFHLDQVRLLVAHETQLAIYDASKMERIRQVNTICNWPSCTRAFISRRWRRELEGLCNDFSHIPRR